jgi:hypothetical protein
MNTHPFFLIPLLILSSVNAPGQQSIDFEQYRVDAVTRWEGPISELEARDRTETHPENSILFIGSSSIRRWDRIAKDMAPYHPIQRGFGGSKWSDVAIFADRLIAPHTFRAVVFYVGNDIAGKDDDRSPEEVAALFSVVWQRVRAHNPDAPIFHIAITPTPSLWDAWPTIREANLEIRRFCETKANTWFIGTESIFLDTQGQPRHELFVEDELHLNADGYLRWSAAIKSHLDTVLMETKS